MIERVERALLAVVTVRAKVEKHGVYSVNGEWMNLAA